MTERTGRRPENGPILTRRPEGEGRVRAERGRGARRETQSSGCAGVELVFKAAHGGQRRWAGRAVPAGSAGKAGRMGSTLAA